MPIRSLVKPGTYRDSVSLMQISATAAASDGVRNAAAVMATPMNRETLEAAGLLMPELQDAGPNDLVVVVDADTEEAAEATLRSIEGLLDAQTPARTGGRQEERPPDSVEEGVAVLPGANLALISTPGTYAGYEAGRCLRMGLHVHMFSDNVPVEDEIALKQYASAHGLLMMGPDCGTAIISGTPLGFANVVERGPIGLVAASGTGAQAITVLVDRLGSGISHAIGTGGRDLSEKVGGIMFLDGLRALDQDPATEVIVLVSKPPGQQTMDKVLRQVAATKKPVVVCLLRGDASKATEVGAYGVEDLEAAARKAVSLVMGGERPAFEGDAATMEALGDGWARFGPQQRYIRGLYSGGTLCDEAMLILRSQGIHAWSNIPIEQGYRLENARQSKEHTVIDLGDDEFTRGKPHPMIDPSTRAARLLEEFADRAVAVIMLDVVLGYGSHPDPAGAMAEAINEGRRGRKAHGEVTVIASVCGTNRDPQNLDAQEAKLREAGVLVFPSNRAASVAAAEVIGRLERR